MIIVVVTGGRNYQCADRVSRAILSEYTARKNGPAALDIWHGGATGADTLAAEMASRHGFGDTPFPADWKRHGRKAGPIRNEFMIAAAASCQRDGHTVVVLAFPGGRGTADCVKRARAHGLEVVEVAP